MHMTHSHGVLLLIDSHAIHSMNGVAQQTSANAQKWK